MELLAIVAIGTVVGIPAAALYAVYRTTVLQSEVERLRQDVTTLKRALARSQRDPSDDPADRRARYEQQAAADPTRPVTSRTAPAGPTPPPGPARPTEPLRGAGPPPLPDMAAPGTDPVTPGGPPPLPHMAARRTDPATPAGPPPLPDMAARGTDSGPKRPEAESGPAGAGPSRGTGAPGGGPSTPGGEPRRPPRDPGAAPRPEPAPAGVGASDALDLETVIGSTWLLRIGLGILAIALALFARTIAPQLPNIAKVALAYAGSMAFFGVGKYFEDRLERFARPVMAGGLAFGFFVAFASHFVPAMRAVPMAGSIVWMVLSMLAVLIAAERWDSEPTAILAIVLGHISAQVTAGSADSYSLVMIGFLGLTAIALLLRHQWVNLGLVGVAGAYGAHMLWLFADRVPPPGDQGFWLNLAFLTSYYVIFLVADILWWRRAPDADALDEQEQRWARALGPTNLALYVSVATFVYFASGASVDAIEWYYITLGVLQGVLAWFYRDLNHRDYVYYPVFGTVLWTIGMFAALDALVLNMVLAGQALLLLLAAHRTGMRVFYYLSQLAMGVAFVHYLVYPPPSPVTVPLLLGGLGVASVYLAKAALEERWYGTHYLLAPFHAVLGGVVVLREAFGFYDTDPTMGLFVVGVHFAIMAVAIGFAGPVLVFTLVTLAVGSPVVVLADASTTGWTSLALLCGLVVSALVLMRMGPRRFAGAGADHLEWQTALIAAMSLVGGFAALDGLATSRLLYLGWMALPLLLLVYRHLADEADRVRSDASTDRVPPDAADVPATVDGRLSAIMYVATSALIIGLVGATIEADLEAPLWIATWSALLVAVAGWRTSRGLFLAGYVLLVSGYTTFFLFDGYVLGLVDLGRIVHPALASWGAALFVVAVPFGVAMAMDREMDQERWARPVPTDPNVLLLLAVIPYLMGFLLVGSTGRAQLPPGWAFVLPAVVGLVLVWQAERWNAPRSVLATVVGLGLTHLYFLSVTGVGGGRAWTSDALLPLLFFALATLVTERLVDRWGDGARDYAYRRQSLIALVVLSTITAMAAIDYSTAITTGWITAGWSVLGGSMMAAGFGLKSSVHRRVALGLLAICVVRVFAIDTVGLSDTARIGAFLVLGLILVGIALLYTRYSDELKKLI